MLSRKATDIGYHLLSIGLHRLVSIRIKQE